MDSQSKNKNQSSLSCCFRTSVTFCRLENTKEDAYKNVSTVFVFTMKVNGVQTTLDSTDFHGID